MIVRYRRDVFLISIIKVTQPLPCMVDQEFQTLAFDAVLSIERFLNNVGV